MVAGWLVMSIRFRFTYIRINLELEVPLGKGLFTILWVSKSS